MSSLDTDPSRASREEAERAYAEGRVIDGLYHECLLYHGTRWGTWSPRAGRQERIADWLARRVRKLRLEPPPPASLAALAERVEGYMVLWFRHRSHLAFSQPHHAWRRPGAKTFDPDATERLIERMRSEYRVALDRSRAVRQRQASVGRERVLAALIPLVAGGTDRSRRALAAELVDVVGMPFETVRRHLTCLKRDGRWPCGRP